jgi:hypothetical protein
MDQQKGDDQKNMHANTHNKVKGKSDWTNIYTTPADHAKKKRSSIVRGSSSSAAEKFSRSHGSKM